MYDPKKIAELKDTLEKWEETDLQKTLASMPERRADFITTSSESINRLYTPLEIYCDGELVGKFPSVALFVNNQPTIGKRVTPTPDPTSAKTSRCSPRPKISAARRRFKDRSTARPARRF